MSEWERVEGDGVTSGTERIPVPGGWLYRSVWRFQLSRFATQEGSGAAFVAGDSGYVESETRATASCHLNPGDRVRLNAEMRLTYPTMETREGEFISVEGANAVVAWDPDGAPTRPEWRWCDLELVPVAEAAEVA